MRTWSRTGSRTSVRTFDRTESGALPVISDPSFEYTTLLLPGNGTNGAQNNTFLDSSTNNFTITRNGNTTQGTFSPFSQTGWSNYFDGSGDYLSAPSNTALEILGGSFTIEFWMCMTSAQGNYGLVSKYGSGTGYGWLLRLDTTFIRWYTAATSNLDRTYSFAVGTWYHIAVVSDGTTGTIYVNGTAQGATFSTNGTQDTSTTVQIGRTHSLTNDFPGYISNLRIVKGTAVYTANFTPSTTPLTAITNTSLLTCQSNRFVDNSSNAFAITRNGDVSVQAFSPFNPTAAWSAATNGGSGYFDGSGDNLAVPAGSAFAYGTGAFTVEAWIYPTVGGVNQIVFSQTVSGTNYFVFSLNTSNQLEFVYATSGGGTTVTGATVQLNQWSHVAAVREGTGSNQFKLYVNGTVVATSTVAQDFTNTTYNPTIGQYTHSATLNWNGYISNLRVVKGTAVYTAAFTPPTAPLTAITNTSLLLNFTNAGIYDATSKNDLETVGNAQISTTQSKFGGSSMYFDGTGDYLFMQSSAQTQNFVFGTGDFTIEMWVYFNSVASGSLFEFRPASTNGAYPLVYFSSSGVLTYYANTNPQINSSSVSTGQWYHFALCRSGTSTKMFLDGTQTGSTYTDSSNYLCRTGGPLIGVTSSLNSDLLNGYIDDLRITKGIARYTSNFTPPTTAFPVL